MPTKKSPGSSEAPVMRREASRNDLGTWLDANDAGDYLEPFMEKGYLSVADLDKEGIEAVVSDKKPGIRNRLSRGLEEWNAKNAPLPKSQHEAPPIPEFKPGQKLDLTTSELKLPDGISFKLPSDVQTQRGENQSVAPGELTSVDWMVIAKNAELFRGWNMAGTKPARARMVAALWKVPEGDFFQARHLDAEVQTTVVYTEESSSYVHEGFDTQSAGASYAFCSMSFEREHREKQAKSYAKKNLYMTGRWYYPRAKLFVEQCTDAHPQFVEAIERVLGLKKGEQPEALTSVFELYGHAYPSEFEVGGLLFFEHTQEIEASASATEQETIVKAAVAIKVGGGSGSAAYTTGSGDSRKEAAQRLSESVLFTARGGKTTLASNPREWADTVNIPKLWGAISWSKMRPTYELLPEPLRSRVKDVWPRVAPVIGAPRDLPAIHNEGRTTEAKSSGFVVAMRSASSGAGGPRGSVLVATAPPGNDPTERDPNSAVAAAYMHKYDAKDSWYDCCGVCMPVRANDWYRYQLDDSCGSPEARVTFVSTKLDLGEWRAIFEDLVEKEGNRDMDLMNSEHDGFLCVSISGESSGSRGAVYARLDGEVVAGSSVHNYSPNTGSAEKSGDEHLLRANFCVPIPMGSKLRIEVRPSSGTPTVRTYWMRVERGGCRMAKRQARHVNTEFTAESDGILHGSISCADGERGTLKLLTGPEGATGLYVAASAHWYTPHDKWGLASSAMLPVRKGATYKASYQATSGRPKADVFWTSIRPAEE